MAIEIFVLEKIRQIDADLRPKLHKFPKKEKIYIVREFMNTMQSLEKNVISMFIGSNKRKSMKEIDVDLEYLRFLIRKSTTHKYMTIRSSRYFTRKFNELGKIIGSWIKKVNSNVDKTSKK